MRRKFYNFFLLTIIVLITFFVFKNATNNNAKIQSSKKTNTLNINNYNHQLPDRSISGSADDSIIIKNEESDEFRMIQLKFKESGLTKLQIKAVYDLAKFQQNMPTFNFENIKRRDKLLEILNQDTILVTESFSKILEDPVIKSDDLSLFLLNTMNLLNLNDQQKSELVVARFSKNAVKFNKDSSVDDNDLSVIIGLSILANLKDQSVKEHAISNIVSSLGKNYNANHQKLFLEYFPELVDYIMNLQ